MSKQHARLVGDPPDSWSPETLRISLLDALAEDGELSTRTLAERMPARRRIVNTACNSLCRKETRWSGREDIVEHHRSWHLVSIRYTASDAYRHLCRLEEFGIVRRTGNREGSAITWEIHPDYEDWMEEAPPRRQIQAAIPNPRYL